MPTTPLRLPVVAAVLALLALPAGADAVRALKLGDSMTGTMEEGVEEVVPFDAVEGTLLDVDIKMAAGSGPAVEIQQPDRTLLQGIPAFSKVDARGASLKIRKIPLAQSGRHYLLVRPAVPGPYAVAVKGKPLTKAYRAGFVFPDPPTEVSFGAVPGALVSVTAKEAEHSGLQAKVLFIRNPGGTMVDLTRAASHVLMAKSDAYKSIPLAELGHYSVGVGTVSGIQGAPGTIQVSVKLPRGKKVKASDAALVLDPFVDEVQPSSGFDNLAYTGVQLAGEFLRPGGTVTLQGPETIPVDNPERLDDATMAFDVDLSGRTTGDYDLVVTYPDGAEGRLVGGFHLLGTPLPSAILPPTGWENRTQSFSVSGTRFIPGLSVAVRPSAGGNSIAGSVTSSSVTSAVVALPLLDAPLGVFDVIATNPDGGTRILPSALTLVRGPRLTNVAPPLVFDNEPSRTVEISGNYFVPGMTCVLERAGEAPVAGAVSGLTATNATATFDLRNKVVGNWTLRVTNPDGGTLTHPAPVAVGRAPRPTGLNGGSRFIDGEAYTGLSASGTDFVSGAQVSIEGIGGVAVQATAEVVNGPGTSVAFDLASNGAAAGDNDLRVTNPDGGSGIAPAVALVLGTRTLTADGPAAGRPAFAYDALDDQYMAAYSVYDGTQWDVRAQRYSASTGKPVGGEILVTSGAMDGSSTEDQTAPCVVFAPEVDNQDGTFGLWMVAYAWGDVNASGITVKVLSQFIRRDGTLMTPQNSGFPIFGAGAGIVTGTRVAWNSTRKEWLVVLGSDDSINVDIRYACIGQGTVYGDGSRVPSLVNSGILINNTHVVPTPMGSATVNDRDYDPDVAWSSTRNEYLVAFCYDLVEAGTNPPADVGIDVRAKVFGPNFTAGPSQLADLTSLGNVSGKDEVHPRVASSGATYLVCWDFGGAAGNRDVRAWLVNATTRALIGASPTTVEATATDDAAFPAIAWDPTSAATGYLVVYPRSPDGSGTSSVVATRFPQSGTTALGTPVHRTLAGTLANAAFGAAGLAVRGNGGEFLAGWTVSGSAKAPANAEVRFAK